MFILHVDISNAHQWTQYPRREYVHNISASLDIISGSVSDYLDERVWRFTTESIFYLNLYIKSKEKDNGLNPNTIYSAYSLQTYRSDWLTHQHTAQTTEPRSTILFLLGVGRCAMKKNWDIQLLLLILVSVLAESGSNSLECTKRCRRIWKLNFII